MDGAMDAMRTLKENLSGSLQAQWRMEQQRAEQMAALAHDLKTPLTIIGGNAVFRANAPISPYVEPYVQGLIGFPLTSLILKKEASRLSAEYRAGNLAPVVVEESASATESKIPAAFRTTPGTLLVVGAVVLVSILINNLTNGILNTFVVALIFGIALRAFGVFKPGILNGIDAYGLMMLAILILASGRWPPCSPRTWLPSRSHC